MLDEWSSYSPSDESSAALDLMIDDPEIHHQAYHRGICHKVLYMLKCGPIELEQKLGLTGLGFKPWGQRCLVYGKRLGTWQLPRKSS
jgi:hypothetical protein